MPIILRAALFRLIHAGLVWALVVAVVFPGLWQTAAAASAEPREVAATEAPVPPDHAAKMREGLDLFGREVRGVLIKNCLRCHGGDSTESDFDMTTREGLLKGGADAGAKTVIVGEARKSRLYKLITHADEPKMPEEAAKLSDAEIASVARWIDLGAPYDKPLIDRNTAVPWTQTVVPPEERDFWSLEPLQDVKPPQVKQAAWVRTPVDAFVLAKLEAKGIALNNAASRRVLIRRASFDLLGLPPAPAEVEAFVADPDPAAYEKLIDRLLASPRYGERWARHWLDVARFAESHGFEHDYDRPFAYHFRDFVIRALNEDMPYDLFLRWQLAGDEIAPDDPLAMMATGFLGAGVFPTQITANEVERTRYDALDDMTATTGSAMLGMSIGCARCHDHKFDPIPQADYYRILATFTTAVRSEIDLQLPPDMAEASGSVKKDKEGKVTEVGKTRVMVVSEGVKPMRHHTQGKDFFEKTYFLNRGDSNQKEEEAEQGFLQVLMRVPEKEKHWQVPRPPKSRTSLRRTALANWITDTKDGAGELAARVIVNRLWQHHFGRGIVATPNDFGKQGDPPSHPELLDYLAGRLIADGWRLKPLHKLMMLSAVYMQSSTADDARAAADPENMLLWRRTATRLDAEVIRDSLLQVGGLLDTRMYGPGTLDQNSLRRSIYFTVKRSQLTPMMQTFDAPEALVSQGTRTTTTVAPQALLLMNAPLVRKAAESFAAKLAEPAARSPAEAVREGFQIAVGRPPTDAEREACVAFMESQKKSYQAGGHRDADRKALADFCQTLFGLNEFVYVE